MDLIREFQRNDIEQVANLHRGAFGLEIARLDRYHSYFSERFLSNEASLPSLVCEDAHGRILGFLGVAVRHFCLEGRKVTAALSSQFVVHPEGRRRLTAIHLLREFLNGPQDLSFTDEANDLSQKIWVALGGSVSTLQGIHWIVPLRPVRLACHRYVQPWMSRALRGPADILDRLIVSLARSPFQSSDHGLRGEPLSPESMLTCLNEITPQCQLRPYYDRESLGALIGRAGGRTRHGSIRGSLLRNRTSQCAGWYLYHFEPGGLAEVLQIASREEHQPDVLRHLASDARAQGASALVGRLEPGLAEPLANCLCLLFRRKYAMLVHSRFPEILTAIHSGRAFISRLEGEWCLRFA